jgi:hypothetical protein
MLHRRDFLRLGVTSALAGLAAARSSAASVKLVLIHGRDQQGKDPALLKAEWLDALTKGAKKINRPLPANLDVAFPFYGNLLDDFAKQMDIPLSVDVVTRGAPVDEDFLVFQGEVAEEIRTAAGVTDAQVDQEYVPNEKPKGPLNWAWVQAILRAVDKHGGGLSASALETFTRDVFLYTRRAGVRDEVDRLVAKSLTEEATVVVAHSLGSVVAYSILRNDRRALNIQAFVTVGSPLAVRAVRDTFRPLRYPSPIKGWFNAFDKRDVVALYPLDNSNFPVAPAIRNANDVKNATSNRHGISGYLDDVGVAKEILDGLGA